MIKQINEIIKESNIVIFAPHFDDFLLMLGGYVLEMKAKKILASKNFHIVLVFPRSNYMVNSGKAIYDTSLERIKLSTGKRLLEDLNCLDELLGEFNYRYELLGEKECFARGMTLTEGKMEYPHGTYKDFREEEEQIFERMKNIIRRWAMKKDTALVFPLAFKEHIDHFIVREAGIKTALELGKSAQAKFYFQEDKPYAGIASEEEEERIFMFVNENKLYPKVYKNFPEEVSKLAFKHYTSQVEEIYDIGIKKRSKDLKTKLKMEMDCDQIYMYQP